MRPAPPWPILAIARLVRTEAERYAVELGYDAESLTMLCAVTSGALVEAYRASGLDAALAMGRYTTSPAAAGHFWALVSTPAPGPAGDRWEPDAAWARRALLVDLTATQFWGQPRVVALPMGDIQRMAYMLEQLGDAARRRVWESDVAEMRELARRCVAEVRGRQLFWRD